MKFKNCEIGSLCELINGRAFKPNEWEKSGLPIIRIQNLNDTTKEFNYYSGHFDSKYLIDNGDLLFSWSGTPGTSFGAFFWNRGEAILNQHIFKVELFENIIFDRYFRYAINRQLYEIIEKAHGGVGLKHITKGKLEAVQIPLPPLPVQEKIVQVLDKARELIDLREKQIKMLDDLVQSVFYDMFGDPVTNPKGWPIVSVIDECECIVPARDKPKSFTGNIPWITINDLVLNSITESSKKNIGLTPNEISEVKRQIIPPFSVLMSCVGDLGLTSINSVGVVINQQLHSFQCRKNVNPVYLCNLIPKRKDYLYKMASSTTVPYLNKTKCNSIPLLLPPISLQNEFASKVQAIEAQKEQMQASLDEMKNNYNSLMQRSFRGDLFGNKAI